MCEKFSRKYQFSESIQFSFLLDSTCYFTRFYINLLSLAKNPEKKSFRGKGLSVLIPLQHDHLDVQQKNNTCSGYTRSSFSLSGSLLAQKRRLEVTLKETYTKLTLLGNLLGTPSIFVTFYMFLLFFAILSTLKYTRSIFHICLFSFIHCKCNIYIRTRLLQH